MVSGYYCPANTEYDNQYPCPSGTYSSATGLQAEGDCTACPGGFYCPAGAQIAYPDECTAG